MFGSRRSPFSWLFLLFLFCSIGTAAQTVDHGDLKKKKLPDTILGQRTLLVHGRFDAYKALRQLFPGKYYELNPSTGPERLINWICPTCKQIPIEDANAMYGDTAVFPYPDGVATRLIRVFTYTDSTGRKNKVMSFNHSDFDADGIQMGRFFSGILGMARFVQIDSGWQLQIFQPAIGGYGSFSQAPAPQPLLIGDHQYAWLIPHVNGGPGGPYQHDLFLIAEVGYAYQPILCSPATGWDGFATDDNSGDSLGHWTYTYSVPPSEKRLFRDIVIVSKGRYFATDNYGLPEELKSRVKGKQKGNFRITRRFVYAGGKGYEELLPAKVWIGRD